MDEELAALKDADVYDLVDRPRDRPVIRSLWVFKVKRGAEGAIERYKARFCA